MSILVSRKINLDYPKWKALQHKLLFSYVIRQYCLGNMLLAVDWDGDDPITATRVWMGRAFVLELSNAFKSNRSLFCAFRTTFGEKENCRLHQDSNSVPRSSMRARWPRDHYHILTECKVESPSTYWTCPLLWYIYYLLWVFLQWFIVIEWLWYVNAIYFYHFVISDGIIILVH